VHPCLIHGSLDPPESASQTASRSVQPFCIGLKTVTDRPRYSGAMRSINVSNHDLGRGTEVDRCPTTFSEPLRTRMTGRRMRGRMADEISWNPPAAGGHYGRLVAMSEGRCPRSKPTSRAARRRRRCSSVCGTPWCSGHFLKWDSSVRDLHSPINWPLAASTILTAQGCLSVGELRKWAPYWEVGVAGWAWSFHGKQT